MLTVCVRGAPRPRGHGEPVECCRRHRDSIPFVVIVQSTLYDDYRRRVVVPLVNKSSLGKVTNPPVQSSFPNSEALRITTRSFFCSRYSAGARSLHPN